MTLIYYWSTQFNPTQELGYENNHLRGRKEEGGGRTNVVMVGGRINPSRPAQASHSKKSFQACLSISFTL
jgi:hypothetical protein